MFNNKNKKVIYYMHEKWLRSVDVIVGMMTVDRADGTLSVGRLKASTKCNRLLSI